MTLTIKLAYILKQRGITQRQLSEMSGVPPATLSDLVRDKRTSINKEHLSAIAEALNITDISDIIELTLHQTPRKEEKHHEQGEQKETSI